MTLRRTLVRLLVVSSLAGAGLVSSSSPAMADFHLMLIREVFAGTAMNANAEFIELQMYSSGQNFVSGKQVRVYGAAGNQVASVTFSANVPNGSNQRSILVATPEAQAAFGVAADLSMTAAIDGAGGKACFVDPSTDPPPPYPRATGAVDSFIDCVSWGSYSPTDVGTPAAAIPPGSSIERKISGGTCATALDSGDDTNNSAADFQVATPSPRPNSATPTEQPCGAGGATATVQGLKTKVKGTRAIITGRIAPPAPGDKVVLTLFANGSPLRKIAKKSAELNGDSEFKKRFTIPGGATRCKVRVGFNGDTVGQKKFRC
jgi:hypothetical protein